MGRLTWNQISPRATFSLLQKLEMLIKYVLWCKVVGVENNVVVARCDWGVAAKPCVIIGQEKSFQAGESTPNNFCQDLWVPHGFELNSRYGTLAQWQVTPNPLPRVPGASSSRV